MSTASLSDWLLTCCPSAGLRQGDEILVLNGKSVAALDLGLMQELFCEQSLSLSIRRDATPEEAGSAWADLEPREPCPPVPILNQMQLLEEFLERHRGSLASSGKSAGRVLKAGSWTAPHATQILPPPPPKSTGMHIP